ncbi:MAG: electron transfer flavoprotein subunit beta/FixA family protein [Syntrophaceae bacterium]|nr:electron transfer flavoprotein subunit beta/FixA family protein [Syntrophaceae bacterium]
MSINILVCIKQVPDPKQFDRITLDPATGSINRTGIPPVTNPVDRHAVEEALRIREAHGGTVTVLTMGPPQARKCLEDALAMGADRGVLLCDMAFAGADTLATAAVLAVGIRTAGDFELVLCGNESVDGATGQVPSQLAEMLGWPRVTHARKIEIKENGSGALVEREIEGGFLRVEVMLPSVIAVVKRINRYRLPTIFGIMEAGRKEIVEVGCAACERCGLAAEAMGLGGSPTRVAGVFQSHRKRHVEMIGGEPKEAARRLIQKLREMDAL